MSMAPPLPIARVDKDDGKLRTMHGRPTVSYVNFILFYLAHRYEFDCKPLA
jgi:hypothetical protein